MLIYKNKKQFLGNDGEKQISTTTLQLPTENIISKGIIYLFVKMEEKGKLFQGFF